MALLSTIVLAVVFFVTSVLSVVTGSTSLITVPVMLQFGMEPRFALATNMFALTLMSIGGTLPYLGKGKLDRSRLPALIMLTLAGSILGALLVLLIPSQTVPQMVSVAMVSVTVFAATKPHLGLVETINDRSRTTETTGYIATFLLGIYGGFFSGGYVTLLTAAYVWLFRLTFIEAIATTKLINVFSSLVATVIFAQQGIINYRLGILLGTIMFVGGIVGSLFALKLDNRWLRRIFLITVDLLALKIMVDSCHSCNRTAPEKITG
jgi:uncharacterized membrane protein YfcA